jgi:hypothetical protein
MQEFAEQNLITQLNVQRGDFSIFGLAPGAHREHFTSLRFFLRSVGDNDSS